MVDDRKRVELFADQLYLDFVRDDVEADMRDFHSRVEAQGLWLDIVKSGRRWIATSDPPQVVGTVSVLKRMTYDKPRLPVVNEWGSSLPDLDLAGMRIVVTWSHADGNISHELFPWPIPESAIASWAMAGLRFLGRRFGS